MSLSITEQDASGATTATYIASPSRVDIVRPRNTKPYAHQLLDVFLPAGYPHSVSTDYMQYQIYDSLQAFSSSIAGLLASRAVLEGVGVGDASASPTSALLLSIVQESMGRIVTILFAHRLGTALEPECKMYRLAADVFNDTAMVLDCLSPVFPKAARVAILSFSSVLRALCGVCAGSAKASLSAHFARHGNLGELNAKDSSQETVISLLGMLAGSLVVSWVSSPLATWSTLIALLSVHLATNYAAVRSVRMCSLNRQRANIVFSSILQHGQVLSPAQVSQRERIFERDGALRWGDDGIIGYAKIGVSLSTLLGRVSDSRHAQTGSLHTPTALLSSLVHVFADEAYILWADEQVALIVLKEGCGPGDQLKAWAHALLLTQHQRRQRQRRREAKPDDDDDDDAGLRSDLDCTRPFNGRVAALRQTLLETRALFDAHGASLQDKGWQLDIGALETRAGTRAVVHFNKEK